MSTQTGSSLSDNLCQIQIIINFIPTFQHLLLLHPPAVLLILPLPVSYRLIANPLNTSSGFGHILQIICCNCINPLRILLSPFFIIHTGSSHRLSQFYQKLCITASSIIPISRPMRSSPWRSSPLANNTNAFFI